MGKTFEKYRVSAIVVIAMLFWSLTYIWYKVVFEALNPITVMLIRLSFSGGFLLLFSCFTGRFRFPGRKNFWWFILLSFFQPFLYFLFESYGVSMVSSTIASVIISTIPLFTPIPAYLFYGSKISILNIAGLLISFVGVVLVVVGKNFRFDGSLIGIILLIGSVVASLGYSVVIVKLTNSYSSVNIIGWQNTIGAFLFLPLFIIFDLPGFSLSQINLITALNLFYLSLFGSSLAYVCFTYSIKQIGVTRASLFTNTIPIFTAIFAYIRLGETLDIAQVFGIVLTLTGLFLGQKQVSPLKQAM